MSMKVLAIGTLLSLASVSATAQSVSALLGSYQVVDPQVSDSGLCEGFQQGILLNLAEVSLKKSEFPEFGPYTLDLVSLPREDGRVYGYGVTTQEFSETEAAITFDVQVSESSRQSYELSLESGTARLTIGVLDDSKGGCSLEASLARLP
jgi:hypothetical protein